VSYAGPQLLSSEHVLTGFDCGKPALNGWLVRRSLSNQSGGTSRTWVVIEVETQRVVGFYASSTASVLRSSAPKKFGRNQPEELPAILLGRIGVDAKHKGKGLGTALLRHFMFKAIEVAGTVGVRLVLAHAKDEEAKSFYRYYGFFESPIDPLDHDGAHRRRVISASRTLSRSESADRGANTPGISWSRARLVVSGKD